MNAQKQLNFQEEINEVIKETTEKVILIADKYSFDRGEAMEMVGDLLFKLSRLCNFDNYEIGGNRNDYEQN